MSLTFLIGRISDELEPRDRLQFDTDVPSQQSIGPFPVTFRQLFLQLLDLVFKRAEERRKKIKEKKVKRFKEVVFFL